MNTKVIVSGLMLSAAAWAQWGGGNVQEFRAQMRNMSAGGDGKCTIEVEVDDVAEVEIMGDVGRLRTLSGGPATWRRFECNSVMPPNPANFRFSGVDGRGRQQLIRQPGRGPAVIRIDDSKGGREGYTFDIHWRGQGGFNNGNNGGWNSGGNNNGGWSSGGNNNGGWSSGGNNNGGWSSGGNNSGWGNNNGWNNSWGNNLNFRGNGRGNFSRRGDQPLQVTGVNVQVSRQNNMVTVSLDTNNGPNSLQFSGPIRNIQNGTITADVNQGFSSVGGQAQANGSMVLTTRGNRVTAINMDGNVAGGRFTMRWDD
jgi:hypothetical protein